MLDPNFNKKLKGVKYKSLDTPHRKIVISKMWIDMFKNAWLYIYARRFFK
jgi:hypothetical protein